MAIPVIYIMGVSGSGKTTIGLQLSAITGIPFFDGDDFHSTSNKEKMKSGIALTDDDREGWLYSINKLAKEEGTKKGAIIACSALKEKYRTILSEGIEKTVHWVFLQGDRSLISERIKTRKNHFMPESLLQSQFDALEIPRNAILIKIDKNPEEIVLDILKVLDSGN
jgi:carbohydrate kinase (thermoresistant glucokinase family)